MNWRQLYTAPTTGDQARWRRLVSSGRTWILSSIRHWPSGSRRSTGNCARSGIARRADVWRPGVTPYHSSN